MNKAHGTAYLTRKRTGNKTIVSLFVVGVCMLTLQSCVYYRTALEAEYRKQADTAYANKQYTKALEYYEKTKFITLSSGARYRVAEIQIKLKQYDEARKNIRWLLFRDRKNILVRELDAYWYFSTGDIPMSVEKYESILEKEPYNTRVLNNLGVIFLNLDDFEKSDEMFRASLEVEPLPVDIFRQYISVVSLVDSEENTTEGSASEHHISGVAKRYIEAYKQKKVELQEIQEIADILSKGGYSKQSYSLYKFISDSTSEDDKEKQLIKANNYFMAEEIFQGHYHPEEVDVVAVAFAKLEKALELGYGVDDDEQREKLITAKDLYVKTDVQKKKILEIYLEYAIISEEEFEQGLSDLSKTVQQGTNKDSPQAQQTDSNTSEVPQNAP